jgi:hypothetical protein
VLHTCRLATLRPPVRCVSLCHACTGQWACERLGLLRLLPAVRRGCGLLWAGQPYDLDELEHKLSELETELLEVNSNQEKLSRSHSELVELQLVLEKAGGFFEEAMRDVGSIEDELRAREQVHARAWLSRLFVSFTRRPQLKLRVAGSPMRAPGCRSEHSRCQGKPLAQFSRLSARSPPTNALRCCSHAKLTRRPRGPR